MYQNYYPQQQPMRMPTPVQYGLKGRPVASLEEARASTIDFDGTIFYFPDLANKRIYTKQINLDGTATLNMYELKEIPVSNAITNYVTREEFEKALNQIQDSLNALIVPPSPEATNETQNAPPAFLF